MSENFAELKRLFDLEVEAMEKNTRKKFWCYGFNEDPKYFPLGLTIAKLLEGYSVTTAKKALKQTRRTVEEASTVNIEQVQSIISSWEG